MVFSRVQVVAAGAAFLGNPHLGCVRALTIGVSTHIFQNLNQERETVAAQDCVWVGVFERDNYWVRQENIYLLL